MLKTRALYAIVLPLVALVGGCLFETTLDAKGAGTMTATYRVFKSDFPDAKKKMESSAVKLTSAELVGPDGVFKIQFNDVTKLLTARYFRFVRVTRAAGSKTGTTVLTAKVKNERPLNLPDAMVERFGKEVKVVVTFPGPVSESNGSVGSGNTVTWTWGTKAFFDTPEVLMTATYAEAGAPAEAGATPESTTEPGDKAKPAAATGDTAKPTAATTDKVKPPAGSGGKAKAGS